MRVLYLSMIILVINCTLWDNIYSQTQTSVRLHFTESFGVYIPAQNGLAFRFNYNHEHNYILLQAEQNFIFITTVVATYYLDLKTGIVIAHRLFQNCERFRVKELSLLNINNNKAGVDLRFQELINILFMFYKNSKPLGKNNQLAFFLFKPNLLDLKMKLSPVQVYAAADLNTGSLISFYQDIEGRRPLNIVHSEIKNIPQCLSQFKDLNFTQILQKIQKNIAESSKRPPKL